MFPHTSTGILHYSDGSEGPRLVVEVDPGIVDFARSLVPPSVKLNRQRYDPHITVVRKEDIPNLAEWGRYDGESLLFRYDSRVQAGHTYWWLRAWSDELVEVRRSLGLPDLSWGCRPPDNEDCFHITIGNTKPHPKV